MKRYNKLLKKLSRIEWVRTLVIKLLSHILIDSKEPLTIEYLKTLGYENQGCGWWVNPNHKNRDRLWVRFELEEDRESKFYRVYRGYDKTFIALKSNKEWFDLYNLIVFDSEKLYDNVGI